MTCEALAWGLEYACEIFHNFTIIPAEFGMLTSMRLVDTKLEPKAPAVPSMTATGAISEERKNAALFVHSLRKGYGRQPVLWDLDLSLGWGECVALFGANGAGKTTLLKVLSTQARADAGTVRVAQCDVRSHTAAATRRIGLVSHRHMLYEDMTGTENLRFYARMFGLQDLQQHITDALQAVRMEQRANQRVRSLSNGQQKRLAIARAILHRPGLLLLDEPEAGLDAEGVDLLGALVHRWTSTGGSVLMTTHNLERGLEWADRAVVLSRGSIAFDCPKDQLDSADFRYRYLSALGVGS